MIEAFFFRSQKQDVTLQFVEPRSDSVRHEIGRLPGVLMVELRRTAAVRLHKGHLSERTALLGVEGGGTLTEQIGESGKKLTLPPTGLVLSDHLARQLRASEGDAIRVEFLQEERDDATATVVRIASEFIGSAAYMERSALNRLMQTPAVADSALLKIDASAEADLFRAVKDAPVVLATIANRQTVRMFRELIDQNLVVTLTIYVLFASVIAIGVTYNASRISFSERAGELATLRVLGHRKREVATILIGEVALLTILAIPVGCLVGYGLTLTIITLFSTDLYRMPFGLGPATYANASIIVAIATAASCATVAWRVHRLDLVRVLKARE
jgi:putative ABC transport system permease protein